MRQRWAEISRLGRVVLGLTACGLAVLILGAAAYLYLPAFGTPSAKALHYSLVNEVGGNVLFEEVFECKQRQDAYWRCEVSDSAGSASATYRLRMDGRLCWRARKLTSDLDEEGPPLDRRPSACVKWHDQIRLLDRFLF